MTPQTTTHDPLFPLLHALRVKGQAGLDGLARALGTAPGETGSLLEDARAAGFAECLEGAAAPWALTAAGRAHHAQALSADRERDAALQDALKATYDTFLALNDPFKALCTDWQTGGDPSSCVDRLHDVHRALGSVLDELAAARSRFAPYRARFAAALTRLTSGDATAFTRPLADSYHDVWMELHEDLLQTLGRRRGHGDDGS